MIKKHTAILLFLVLGLASIIIYSSYKFYFPDQKEEFSHKLEEFDRVKVGMSIEEVAKFIGNPFRVNSMDAPLASYVYRYKVPAGYIGIFEMAVDSTLHVVDITNTIRKKEQPQFVSCSKRQYML